jgi:hypothetical protein
MLSFSISYPDLIKLPYFTDTTERFGGEKRPKEEKKKRVTLWITPMCCPNTIEIFGADLYKIQSQ